MTNYYSTFSVLSATDFVDVLNKKGGSNCEAMDNVDLLRVDKSVKGLEAFHTRRCIDPFFVDFNKLVATAARKPVVFTAGGVKMMFSIDTRYRITGAGLTVKLQVKPEKTGSHWKYSNRQLAALMRG